MYKLGPIQIAWIGAVASGREGRQPPGDRLAAADRRPAEAGSAPQRAARLRVSPLAAPPLPRRRFLVPSHALASSLSVITVSAQTNLRTLEI